ncbi:ABC transporter permease [Microbacterium marinilacus]|uniref:ABC transporter permease n=1 Tax=Microbacterium marinilacus TaxID=415209 RepID=A0ABP7B211_9MICO|nr:ABC transporter permease subunit [Microbacterium marinilacus]MBY0688599.1 ABC transporter permease subunit [Microbacterium marinilacus]
MTSATAPADGRAPFLQSRWSTPVLGATGILVFLALWEAAPRLDLVNAAYLPPFSEVVPRIAEVVAGPGLREEFWRAVSMTMLGWAAGLAIALVLGVVLGVVIGSSRWIREYTGSTIEFLRPIPSVGLIPVAVVIFGVRPTATVFVVAWACFWVVLVHVIAGVADVDPVADATARSYGMGPLQRAAHVVWPTALPYLMTGTRLSATIALVVAITIEIVVGAPGIGQMIATYQSAGNVGVVYALAILAGVLGLLINLAMRRLEDTLLAWHSSVRQEDAA